MSDLVFTWEGGSERPLPQNIATIRDLARDVRKLEESLASSGAAYAHYLGVVQDWATEDGKYGKPGSIRESEVIKEVQEAARNLASAAAALRRMAASSAGVQQAAEERKARMSQLAAKAAKIAG